MALTTAQRRAAEKYVKDLVLSQKITVQDDAFYKRIEQEIGVKRRMAHGMICDLLGRQEIRTEMVKIGDKIQCLTVRADATHEDLADFCRRM